jgi:hypothetical protein
MFSPFTLPGGTLRVRASFMLATVCTPSSLVRERERERERERKREKEIVFIFKRNDGCLGTF